MDSEKTEKIIHEKLLGLVLDYQRKNKILEGGIKQISGKLGISGTQFSGWLSRRYEIPEKHIPVLVDISEGAVTEDELRLPSLSQMAMEVNNVKITVSRKLKKLREDSGLSLRELALKVGARAESIRGFEAGLYNPSINTAYKLKEFFGLSCIDDLIEVNKGEV